MVTAATRVLSPVAEVVKLRTGRCGIRILTNPATGRVLFVCAMLLASLFAIRLDADAAEPDRVANSTEKRAAVPRPSKFFRRQYHVADDSFCISMVCVDFDNDGRRELLFASRKTKELQMLRATDGKVLWRKPFVGNQQSLSAYDLDGDGDF